MLPQFRRATRLDADRIDCTILRDLLGNMLNVNQHGLGPTFQYDNLSRLTYALNPAVGTDIYTYSNSSSACSPSAGVPCQRTDARLRFCVETFAVEIAHLWTKDTKSVNCGILA
jgi:hypothetical protein